HVGARSYADPGCAAPGGAGDRRVDVPLGGVGGNPHLQAPADLEDPRPPRQRFAGRDGGPATARRSAGRGGRAARQWWRRADERRRISRGERYAGRAAVLAGVVTSRPLLTQ